MIRVLADLARAAHARVAGWAAQGLTAPVPVSFGAERVDPFPGPARARVRHDPAGDVFESPGQVRTNIETPIAWKWTGVVVLVEGASTESGAGEEAHRALVEMATDIVLGAFMLEARGAGHPLRQITGGFVEPDDAPDAPLEFGARYLLRFQFGRSVSLPDYQQGTGLVPVITTTATLGEASEVATLPPDP